MAGIGGHADPLRIIRDPLRGRLWVEVVDHLGGTVAVDPTPDRAGWSRAAV